MSTNMAEALYVHIPFCSQICFYCGFTRILYQEKLADQYISKVLEQLQEIQNPLTSIYVGGGTPTALNDDQFEQLLIHLKRLKANDCEFTIEANPDSLTDSKCALMVKHGVNRVSMGVQCSQKRLLKAINRSHDFEQVKVCTERLRHYGITNFSMDIMYGFQTQTIEDLQQSIEDITSLEPVHISIYALTIEENSVFGKQQLKPVDNELESEMYFLAIKELGKRGYNHYEISNFAKEGFESRHNKVYWHFKPFYAFGAGASNMLNHHRQTYKKSIAQYIVQPEFEEDIALTLEDEMFEFVMMGLRLKEGISKSTFFSRFNRSIDDVFANAIKQGLEKHLLVNEEDVLRTTYEGFVMLFDTLLYFMDE